MIRVGEYAIVDGVEHSANIHSDEITLLLPQSVPRPDGWLSSQGNRWKFRIPRSRASRLFRVDSVGYFKDLRVSVRDVRPMDEAVGINRVKRSPEGPPDPVFESDPDPGVAEWRAIVPWGMVTDVQEWITEIPVFLWNNPARRANGRVGTLIRAGDYAIVDGIEYETVIMADSVFLLIPQSVPCPAGWLPSERRRWKFSIPRTSASKLFNVYSVGYFNGIRVSVRDVHPMDEAVGIKCTRGSSDVPPEPVFESDPDVDEWRAIVPWDTLTDVQEEITPIGSPVDQWR